MSNASTFDFVMGSVAGLLFGVTLAGLLGLGLGFKDGHEQGILIGESRANAAHDKKHYDTCNLVRTFTPKNSPQVECYVCPGSTEEICLVPSWKVVGAP